MLFVAVIEVNLTKQSSEFKFKLEIKHHFYKASFKKMTFFLFVLVIWSQIILIL